MTELTEYPDTGQLRVYDIEAISLPVVYNKYGDPAPPILKAYVGDPSKIRLIHGASRKPMCSTCTTTSGG